MQSSSGSSSSFDGVEWNRIVNRVLNAWGGYQLAVQMDAGGPDTKEKHEWFASVLAEHIHEKKGLKIDNLEEWMENILYTDFDLVLEDDSINPTSHILLELHSYLKTNNRMRLEQLLATLPNEEEIRKAANESRGLDDGASTSGDEDAEMQENAENEAETSGPRVPKEKQPRTVTDDDGWTTIVKRK
ncbi:unnamed protein product, partial [Mesorhabditis belari]|uniref:Pre-rRNA-processing protein TSR2 homolog n=1 Tax=Mesorhabditis belari TaxID=2138241 RepID=A0AAF3FMJ3_9BILA